MIFQPKAEVLKVFERPAALRFLALAGLTMLIKRLDDFYPEYCSHKFCILLSNQIILKPQLTFHKIKLQFASPKIKVC